MNGELMHVVIGWDDEREAPWLGAAHEGDSEESSEQFEADIPIELWNRIEIAEKALSEAFEAAADAAGYDSERARMKQRCPEWQGHISDEHTSWAVIVPASGDQEHWPLHDHAITYLRSKEEAVDKIAALPDEFTIVHAGLFTSLIRRDSLRIDRLHRGVTFSACTRCGWSRVEHLDEA